MSAQDVELVHVVRNDVVESVHRGHVVVCDSGGGILAALGDPTRLTYVRSAVKPFQALATLDLLAAGGRELDEASLAIVCASHDGADDQVIEAARVLAEAGLDEGALQCPPALPRDPAAIVVQRTPQPLAHNCSGKHAGFLAAMAAAGQDPAAYLAPDSLVQRQVVERLVQACGVAPQGPGIDGCGAPAWLLPLAALATGFARLAAGQTPQLARVRNAMQAHPQLIGGSECVDTRLMQHDGRVVAKRGAEAVFAAGVARGAGSVGIAAKTSDGGVRADGPIIATVLAALGIDVPPDVRAAPLYGGGAVQGVVRAAPQMVALADGLTGT
jgi:L-asparaginase II